MAVLASFAAREEKPALADFLDEQVFRSAESTTLMPEPMGVEGCEKFIERYKAALSVEQSAGVLADE